MLFMFFMLFILILSFISLWSFFFYFLWFLFHLICVIHFKTHQNGRNPPKRDGLEAPRDRQVGHCPVLMFNTKTLSFVTCSVNDWWHPTLTYCHLNNHTLTDNNIPNQTLFWRERDQTSYQSSYIKPSVPNDSHQ